MKSNNKPALILLVAVLAFSLTTCNKQPTEVEKKEELLQTLLSDIVADSLQNDVLWLQNMGTRFMLTPDRKDVALKLKTRFTRLGYETEIDSFLVTRTYRSVNYVLWEYNVTAKLQGTEYPDSLCVIGGHYDNILNTGDPFTIVPGANDNASGVAAVLEIARIMSLNNYKPESTIMFVAFGSEELGLYGSKDFAADPPGSTNKIRFMLNFDMIAFEPSSNPSSWIVNIMDYDNSHLLRKEAESMCAKYTQLQYINDNTHNMQSDSYPFFTNGFKAIFFFANTIDPNYHTLSDLAENCNFIYCSEIVKASCALLVNKN